MPSLAIPQSGLSLGSFPAPPSKPSSAFPDVFGLTLTDGVIEEMIKCVQNGKLIQLSLGEHPVSFQSISLVPTILCRVWLWFCIVQSILTIASLAIVVHDNTNDSLTIHTT
jgi:hypothetical protein